MARQQTTDEYERRLARVDKVIEDNLDDVPSPTELAKVAAFAPHHFHRIFRAQRGESVMQRVRRLRLTRAAKSLTYSDASVLTIALDAGYGSHEAFTRAFSEQFAQTPSQHRSRPTPRIAQHLISSETSPLPNVEIQTLPALRVLALRHHGPFGEVGGAFAQLAMWAQKTGRWPRRQVGLCPDDPDLVAEEKLRIDACLVLDDDDVVEDTGGLPLKEHKIPGGRFAVLVHEGTYAKLSETYLDLIGRWLPTTPERPTSDPILEMYLNDPTQVAPPDLRTAVCLPLFG